MARVLLAEDDAAMRDVVARALGGDGHTVVMAQDGLEALELVSAPGAVYDVMLTDIQMPSLDGIALASRALSVMPALRIILMTAYAGSVTIPAALEPRIARILTKPLAIDAVRAAVREVAG